MSDRDMTVLANMAALPIVLLPGLDGTGDLLASFASTAPPHLRPSIVALPPLSSYSELLEAIRGYLPATGSFAIVGESFSGPLAVAVARDEPERVVGVILCNTFVSPPLTAALRFFPWSLLFLFRPPKWAIRLVFTGRRASPDLVSSVSAAVAKTPRRLLAERMRAVFSLPALTELLPIAPPVLCLSGTDDLLVFLNTRAFDRLSSRVVYKRIAAPHLLLQVAPAEAWGEISAFLAGGEL